MVSYALANGASQWLPPNLALEHPLLLAAALNQLAQITDLRRHAAQTGKRLRDFPFDSDRVKAALT